MFCCFRVKPCELYGPWARRSRYATSCPSMPRRLKTRIGKEKAPVASETVSRSARSRGKVSITSSYEVLSVWGYRLFNYPWSRVLLEKLTVTHLVKEVSAFYGTRRFVTAFTRSRHWSLSWARWIQSTPSHPISLGSILMSSRLRLGLPSELFPSDLTAKIFYAFLISPACYIISFSLIWSHTLLIRFLLLPVNVYRLLTLHVPNLISIFRCLVRTKESAGIWGPM